MVVVLLAVGLVFGAVLSYAQIRVYVQEQRGKADLREAEWSRQVAVEEAKARNESTVLDAEAEVARARGVAEANAIIADGLKGNEEYLRYLWITKLNSEGQVIYVPTKAGLPILEAGRR